MSGKKYEDKLFLDIPFGAALERFAKTDTKEVAASVARSKKAKPPGGKLRKPPGGSVKSHKVVRLADKRKPKRG